MFCQRFGRKDRFCIASARIWKYRASQLFLTRKLLTFLSRLNESSGGCKKIAPVSGSFCSILKLLRMMAFTGL